MAERREGRRHAPRLAPGRALEIYKEIKARWPKVMVEVSGGIRPDNVIAYAHAADRISLGWLTHSAPAVDVGLDVVAP